MKKLSSFMTLLLLCTMTFTACKDKNEVTNNDSNSSSNNSANAMTADQQKEYLENSGKQILATFKTVDQKEAVELADGLYRKYESYDWESIGEDLAQIDDGRYDNFFAMPGRLARFANGEQVPTARDILVFSFAECAYNFEVDEAKRTIRYSKSVDGTCTATFRDELGNTCVLKAWGEGAAKEYEYSYESTNRDGSKTTKTIQAQIPATTHMVLMQGKTEVINCAFGLDALKNDHIYVTFNLKVTNVAILFDTRVNSTHATALYEFSYGDQKLIAATADLPKYKLIDKQDNQDWEEWIEQYEDRYEELLRAIGAGYSTLNLMNLVNIKASISDGGLLYSEVVAWDERGNRNTKESVKNFCDIFNKYMYGAVFFPSDPATEQMLVKLQPRSYEGYQYNPETDDYEETTCYEPEPVIYFPKDKSSYAFEDYFTSERFNTILTLTENLINSYIDLDNEFDLGHVEF